MSEIEIVDSPGGTPAAWTRSREEALAYCAERLDMLKGDLEWMRKREVCISGLQGRIAELAETMAVFAEKG